MNSKALRLFVGAVGFIVSIATLFEIINYIDSMTHNFIVLLFILIVTIGILAFTVVISDGKHQKQLDKLKAMYEPSASVTVRRRQPIA